MSDLISRSGLLEKYCNAICPKRQNGIYCENCIIKCWINEQPTAYDIDKVVEKLEADERHTFDGCINKRYAIEIVKQGSVSDDVCAWEKGSSGYVGYPAYYSKCCTIKSGGLEMQTHIIADWKYCPYCGKKIKVVDNED